MPINRSALLVLAERVHEDRQRQQKLDDARQEFEQRYRLAGIQGEIKRGALGYNVQTGQWESRTLPVFDPASLRPGERATVPLPGGGTRTYAGPSTKGASDPLVRANRIAALQSRLQGIEQKNALGPAIAMAEREKAFPPPQAGFIGGYTENKPNLLQGAFGARQRPQAAAVPTTDTTFLRQQLQQAISGTSGEWAPSDPIAQRIQQLRAQGVADQTIAQHLIEKGIDPSQYGL